MKTIEKRVGTAAKRAEVKSFMKPDEVREFPKGRVEIIKIGGATVAERFWSRAGGGRNQFSPSPKQKAARRRIFSITYLV